MRHMAFVLAVPIAAASGPAKEMAGVSVPPTVSVHNAESSLNGAGVRTRFFVKVHGGALYLKYRVTTADKLTGAWNDGFTGNRTPAELEPLQPASPRSMPCSRGCAAATSSGSIC
jgi:hypothetical protein